MEKVDLHIHSYHSDGTLSPEEIMNEAIEKNIKIISITDHNTIRGAKEMCEIIKDKNIEFIPGVEIDVIENGINYHVLAYGIDLKNIEFNEFIENNERLLEQVNIQLIKKIEKDYEHITLDDYLNFSYNRKKGGWKALHYFIEKNLSKTLLDGISIYIKYSHSYSCVEFPNLKEAISRIKNANGKAILAHPGRVIKKDNIENFREEIHKLLDMGLDGIECYYPSHSDDITNICLNICNEKNLLITCGSDCHGEFEETKIGELDISIENLNLIGLVK